MPQIADLSSIMVGDSRITFLPDGGGIVEPTALYPASTAEGWQSYPDLLDENGKFITSIGGFMIEIGDRKIAVDMGIGPVTIDFPGFGPFSGGKYPASVRRAGIDPAEVTDVIFTHLHLDHCGWTTVEVNGTRRLFYPNARYLVTQTEWDFWLGGDNPAGPHPEFVQKPLEGRVEMMADGDEIAPNIVAVATPGHTPGHTSLLITGASMCCYLVADVLHGRMQLQEPAWSVAFDTDAALARASRERLYEELVRLNTITAVNHFSDAVFGRIVDKDGSKRWMPL